ncbi:MAG: patatin-like phospholipase family protein [Anaerolineae bacterium]|nr:patatin-like phospholipase family protein [Anaerolineae bacterium]
MSQTLSLMPNVKTALVLAGGGLTGAVYEIGALRAIDDLLVDLDTSRFDIYVGTSAGAMISAFLANGITPAELMRGLDSQHPRYRGPRRREIFSLNVDEWAERVRDLPRTLLGASSHYLRHWREMRPLDAALSLTEAIPTAFYHNLGLARYIQDMITLAGGSDSFMDLDRELYIIATDLDSGDRAVFGEGDLADVPISMAVAASSAVPLLYRPVRIKDHDYVDGGVRGMASLDVAIEHGAKLVVVVNSAVPLDNSQHSQRSQVPFLNPKSRRLSDKGAPAVVAQVYRTLFHAGLSYHIKQVARRHRDVTIILIEPEPTDGSMFFFNSMRYSARLTVAQHGYQSVTLNLTQDYHRYKDILSRFGIRISPRLVAQELERMREAGNSEEAIREVMEDETSHPPSHPTPVAVPTPSTPPPAPVSPDGRVAPVSATERLDQVLQKLEAKLDAPAGRKRASA